jgi:hypothetical protein
MVMEDPGHSCHPVQPSRARSRGRGAALAIVVVTLAVALSATLSFVVSSQGQEPPRSGSGSSLQQNQFKSAEQLFANWPKPDVALIISGQMHGYLQPCGCSEPQFGGLARRFNFIKSLTRDRGWNVVLADVGDLPQASGPQAVMKYKYAMRALKLMGYSAISFGKNEMGLGLVDLLGSYALNDPQPRVIAANLANRDKLNDMVGSGIVSNGTGPKVGFVSIVDKRLLNFEDPDVKLEDNVNEAVKAAMSEKAFQDAKPELLVLLFQGTLEDAKKIALSTKLPKFDAIAIPWPEEEARSDPIKVGKTLIFSAGQRGRNVSVLGAYRTNNPEKPFEFRYQLVAIGPQYETPSGQDASNPIHELLQDYAQSVKNNNMLEKFTKHPSKHPTQLLLPGSKYVGTDKCKQCHEAAYNVWSNSGHSHAYDSLVKKAVRPSLRQFDGECLRCHVTGFGYESGFVNQAESSKLINVGCESCHGPGSEHVKKPNDPKIQAIINPWKHNPKVKNLQGAAAQDMKMLLINDSCAVCHDLDNSVNFKVEPYWKKVEHLTPKE